MSWVHVASAGVLMVALGAGSLAAQGPGGGMRGGMMAAPQLEELKTTVNLDAEQEVKVKALLAKHEEDTKGARDLMQKNMQAMREGAATDAMRQESQGAMASIRDRNDKLNKEIREVLRPDQHEAFDGWVAARAARRPGGQRPPPA